MLGAVAIAALATALGVETDIVAPLWLVAIAWMVLASLAGALLRGFRRGNWSAFRSHRFPEDGGEMEDRLRDGERIK